MLESRLTAEQTVEASAAPHQPGNSNGWLDSDGRGDRGGGEGGSEEG